MDTEVPSSSHTIPFCCLPIPLPTAEIWIPLQTMTSLFIALGHHVAALSLPTWRSSKGQWPEGCTSPRAFLVMSLAQVAGRQQPSLQGGSVQHTGPSVPLRRESPTTIAHISSFGRWSSYRCQSFLFSSVSGVEGPSSTSPSDLPFTSRASSLLCTSIWEGKAGKEGVCLLLQTGTCPCSLFLSYCLLHGRGGI